MKKFILFSLMLLLFVSCQDMMEEVPKSFLSPVNYYKTATDAEGAILSVYASWASYSSTSEQYIIEEIHSDYSIGRGSYTPINNFNQPFESVINGHTNNIWSQYYDVINKANIVLARIPNIVMDEVNKKKILAEAYFLRADAYIHLVRYWGAVPLRLTEMTDLSKVGAPRTPVNQIYEQIISDLKIAETDLPEVGTKTGRVSIWAAKMKLADVYLGIEDWANAAAKSDEVIKSNKYSLVTVKKESDFYNIFATETNSEDILSWHSSPLSLNFQNFVQWLHYTDTPVYCLGTGWWCLYVNVNSPMIINWDKNDLRYQFNIYSGFYRNGVWVNNPPTTPLLFKKYIKDPNGFATYSVPVIRYTEAFLIYTEAACMAEGSPSPLALERLNIIKRRGYGNDPFTVSGIDYTSGMSKEDFRNTVIKERSYEFMLEDRRYWDLLRTNTIKQVTLAAKNITYIDARLLFPIPQQEINTNPDLKQTDQNPGY